MPSVKLSPVFNDTQFDSNGLLLTGGMIYSYISGTTTPIATYTESTGSISQTNPILLNSRGEPINPIWLATGQLYTLKLYTATNVLLKQYDNIQGINDTTAPIISEWVLYAGSAQYISATSFSVTGDATGTFTIGRRTRATVSGGTAYSTITNSVFGSSITTVTVVNDSTPLDSGLSTVYYGFLDPTHPSFDTSGVNSAIKSAFQTQTYTAFTTGGSAGTYTLTPVPAIVAYAVNQRFNVIFHAAGTGTDTINVNGLGAKNIKRYDSSGAKIAPSLKLTRIYDLEYDGTDFVILNDNVQLTSTTQAASDNSTLLATTAFVYALLNNQTWQDVTASRAINTNYTNSTGRPIIVQGYLTNVSAGALNMVVGGNTLSHFDAASGAPGMPFYMIVPNGSTYQIQTSGTVSLTKWWELK